MTEDEKEVEKISQLNEQELLDYIMDNCEYMTDHYYYEFAKAIIKRYKYLKSRRST